MKRQVRIFSFLVFTLAALVGCSSEQSAKVSKKAAAAPDKIQGKAQVLEEAGGAGDAALNAGGPSVYIWEGTHRYRLFFKNAFQVFHGSEYVVEGVFAQKAIEEIGDPDQGKKGYPLQSSCERVITTAWNNLSFDAIDANASALCARIKRYPARPVFLVVRIRSLTPEETSAAAGQEGPAVDEKKIPEVSVPAEKQQASLIEGQAVQTAPLWEPAGGTVRCKVIINSEGKISELETGAQLCETVDWSKFRYKPTLKSGHPVRVSTEVEVRFEPRK